MIDKSFPSSLIEFQRRFPDEEACRSYLLARRWPSGFQCPRCGHGECWGPTRRELYVCRACQHHTSLRSGTAMEGSKKPLLLWMWAMFLVASSKQGISAKELQRQLGFRSYQTAWAWLHKLREAMKPKDSTKLSQDVEVDETFVGGVAEGKRGRGAAKKTIVVAAVEILPRRACGRVRLQVVPNAKAESLVPFVEGNVEQGVLVKTDGHGGYKRLTKAGYAHRAVVVPQKDASKEFPRVHRAFSLLKRWILCTHQGSHSPKHLQAYLDEFTFRFNRRFTTTTPSLVFQRLSERIGKESCRPYWKIVGRLNPATALA